jgi:hypothetical protein
MQGCKLYQKLYQLYQLYLYQLYQLYQKLYQKLDQFMNRKTESASCTKLGPWTCGHIKGGFWMCVD